MGLGAILILMFAARSGGQASLRWVSGILATTFLFGFCYAFLLGRNASIEVEGRRLRYTDWKGKHHDIGLDNVEDIIVETESTAGAMAYFRLVPLLVRLLNPKANGPAERRPNRLKLRVRGDSKPRLIPFRFYPSPQANAFVLEMAKTGLPYREMPRIYK